MNRIIELRSMLSKANARYYSAEPTGLSDTQFDALMRELIELEAQHPELKDPTSPSQRVGTSAENSFEKINHSTKMLSLDNAFTPGEVVKFFDNQDLLLEPKIDGLSLSLEYKGGKLVQAVTRGDGSTGDSVLENAKTIRSIPLEISVKGSMIVRGEVYMRNDTFAALNEELIEEGSAPMANPRNAAAGALKLKDSRECASRRLDFIAYRLIASPNADRDIVSHFEDPMDVRPTQLCHLEVLGMLGFSTPLEFGLCELITGPVQESEIAETLSSFNDTRKKLPFQTDGAVLKVNSILQQYELGEGTKSVKWGLAYKYPPEQAVTELLDITLTVGKSGQICPNAVLEPVLLEGTTVKAASLFNRDYVEQLGLGVGDHVFVEKAAFIIPTVSSVANKREDSHYAWPETCPSCNTRLERKGVHYFCPNHSGCPAQIKGRLVYATSKSCLDMDGCGEAVIEGLMKSGCKTLSDLFAATEGVVRSFVPGNAAQSKFLAERESAKSKPLWRKLAALCIDGIGKTYAKELAQKYRSIENMASAQDLDKILGNVARENFRRYLITNLDEIVRLDELGLVFEETGAAGLLSGKTFVITGSLASGTRDQVSALIESNGGMVKGSVSKKVNYLIAGEDCGRTKTEAAKKHGVSVITETELYSMLGMDMPTVNPEEEKEY